MSEKEFSINDMALEGKKEPEKKLDMSLTDLNFAEVATRISTTFPDQDINKVDEKVDIVKMASGGYNLGDTALKDCTPDDLNRIDAFLKSKKG